MKTHSLRLIALALFCACFLAAQPADDTQLLRPPACSTPFPRSHTRGSTPLSSLCSLRLAI